MSASFDTKPFDSGESYRIFMDSFHHFSIHRHNYVEIFYVLNGSFRLTTGDVHFQLDEGHICFVNSGELHSVNQNQAENHMLILQIGNIRNEFLTTLQKYRFSSDSYLQDLANGDLPLKDLQRILLEIYQEEQDKQPGYQHVILSLINALLAMLMRRHYLVLKTNKDCVADNNYLRFVDIMEYLDTHYQEKLSLTQLADTYHINYYYLSHFFKETAGIPLKTYLNNLRLDKSLPLLLENTNTITQIALDCGFPNVKAYTIAFRDKFGSLPSKYRKSMLVAKETPIPDMDALVQTYMNGSRFLFSDSENTVSQLLRIPSVIPRTARHHCIPSESILAEALAVSDLSETALAPSLRLTRLNPCLLSPGLLKHVVEGCHPAELVIGEDSFSPALLRPQLARLFGRLGCSVTTTQEEICVPPHEKNITAFSLLHSCSILQRFFQHFPNQQSGILCQNQTSDSLGLIFDGGLNLITEDGIPSPGLYAYSFLSQLKGQVIYHSEAVIIVQNSREIQLLCYHAKSYHSYLQLTNKENFSPENYHFFAQSFPPMNLSFIIKKIKGNFRKIGCILDNEHGSLMDTWLNTGAPLTCSDEYLSYLQAVTQPALCESAHPFSEDPIVSVELPPLGCAFIRLLLE